MVTSTTFSGPIYAKGGYENELGDSSIGYGATLSDMDIRRTAILFQHQNVSESTQVPGPLPALIGGRVLCPSFDPVASNEEFFTHFNQVSTEDSTVMPVFSSNFAVAAGSDFIVRHNGDTSSQGTHFDPSRLTIICMRSGSYRLTEDGGWADFPNPDTGVSAGFFDYATGLKRLGVGVTCHNGVQGSSSYFRGGPLSGDGSVGPGGGAAIPNEPEALTIISASEGDMWDLWLSDPGSSDDTMTYDDWIGFNYQITFERIRE